MTLELNAINGEQRDVGILITYGKILTHGETELELATNAKVFMDVEFAGKRVCELDDLPNSYLNWILEEIHEEFEKRTAYAE